MVVFYVKTWGWQYTGSASAAYKWPREKFIRKAMTIKRFIIAQKWGHSYLTRVKRVIYNRMWLYGQKDAFVDRPDPDFWGNVPQKWQVPRASAYNYKPTARKSFFKTYQNIIFRSNRLIWSCGGENRDGVIPGGRDVRLLARHWSVRIYDSICQSPSWGRTHVWCSRTKDMAMKKSDMRNLLEKISELFKNFHPLKIDNKNTVSQSKKWQIWICEFKRNIWNVGQYFFVSNLVALEVWHQVGGRGKYSISAGILSYPVQISCAHIFLFCFSFVFKPHECLNSNGWMGESSYKKEPVTDTRTGT